MIDATCTNHPERTAVERCEVCSTPLCAYCLYYTSDGQRLCKLHADQAETAGAFIRSPGVYAGGLISAQVSASEQKPRATTALYEGNTPDVVALIGMVIAVVGLLSCIPPLSCLVAPIALIVSIIAFITARDARNPKRTRTMAGIGLGLSGLVIVALMACGFLYYSLFTQAMSSVTTIQITMQAQFTLLPLTSFPRRPTVTLRPTQTPTAELSATPGSKQ